jgi:PBP1b-binding outer membrane lipoprotein LpoB
MKKLKIILLLLFVTLFLFSCGVEKKVEEPKSNVTQEIKKEINKKKKEKETINLDSNSFKTVEMTKDEKIAFKSLSSFNKKELENNVSEMKDSVEKAIVLRQL